ncbi:MAG: hypothetical protein V7709_01000 [Halioglobus sp.]
MTSSTSIFGSTNRYRVFTWVKYLTYALLSVNIYLFLQQELTALEYTFADGIEPGQIIQSFSATIDTGSWVLLLLLFELETSVLNDSQIRGVTKWMLHGVRGICYIAIAYAFTGYYAELVALYNLIPMPSFDPCSAIAQNLSILVTLDEYSPLDASNCASMSSLVYRLEGFEIIADDQALQVARGLAWADILNAGAWILVVIVLEVEVRLQLRGNLSDKIMDGTKFVKLALYGTLFCAALYWGYAGAFLDFWDACLWLFAFIFIELNVFEWQNETSREGAPI